MEIEKKNIHNQGLAPETQKHTRSDSVFFLSGGGVLTCAIGRNYKKTITFLCESEEYNIETVDDNNKSLHGRKS